jgi:hypothetical protein
MPQSFSNKKLNTDIIPLITGIINLLIIDITNTIIFMIIQIILNIGYP